MVREVGAVGVAIVVGVIVMEQMVGIVGVAVAAEVA